MLRKRNIHPNSIKGKILVALIFATVSIALLWLLSQLVFNKVAVTIEEISRPSEETRIINNIVQSLAETKEFRIEQVLKKYYLSAEKQDLDNQYIIKSLDSLRNLFTDNKIYLQRLDSMEAIMLKYNLLLTNYLGLYRESIDYKKLSNKYRALSEDYLSYITNEIDTSVITSEKKIITIENIHKDGLNKEEDKSLFFQWLFGKKRRNRAKKPKSGTDITKHKEELVVRIDTLTAAAREEYAKKFEETIDVIDQYHQKNSARLSKSELILINTANDYINRFHSLLQMFEVEDLERSKQNTDILIKSLNTGINRMTIVLLAFVLVTSILSYLIFIDISRSNQYRKELLKAKEKAENLGTAKHRFLANMSHEIRTPLQSIVGFSEQLIHQQTPNKEDVGIIHQSSIYLLQIVNEILDYSRIVSGKYTFERQAFNMSQLLGEVVDTMNFLAKEKKLEFSFKNDAMEPGHFYYGDPFRLKQILNNLIGNAIKFTDRGKVELKVVTDNKDEGIRFHFIVKDTGVGIAKKDMERIFNEFEQSNHTLNNKNIGTGLGLNIVKSLVELQGGNIWGQSEKGKGSIFRFWLIFEKAADNDIAIKPTVETNHSSFNEPLVFVDDDEFILKLCSDIFKKYNIPHSCYLSPNQLLSDWEKVDASVIFMDIRMPEMNGFELCARLKKITKRKLFIVALTAQALLDEKSAILTHGFDRLILKPFKEKDILQVLNSIAEEKTTGLDFVKSSPLVKMSMGDKRLLLDNLESFVHETSLDIATFQKNLKEQNKTALADIAHKLAGRVGQVGHTDLSMKLRELEKNVEQKKEYSVNSDDANNIIEELLSLINRVSMEYELKY